MSTATTPMTNEVLAALSTATAPSLLVNLTPIDFTRGDIVSDVGKYIYFPVDCLIGQINLLQEGGGSAVYLMGRNSMVGSTLLLGSGLTNLRFVVQCSGTAFRMPASELVSQFNDWEDVRQVLLKVIYASMSQMAETAVCNQRHSIEQQMCRWVLMSLDLLPEHKWDAPQDIAVMMGLSHKAYRDAARQLESLGAIEIVDTGMVIRNRALIQAMCCGCYTAGPQGDLPVVENDES